jgi:hypothetical protein
MRILWITIRHKDNTQELVRNALKKLVLQKCGYEYQVKLPDYIQN